MKGKDGRTAWDRRFGKEFQGKLIPFGSKVVYRRTKHDAAKFAPRGSEGIMLGHHLEPGGLFKGDYLVLNTDNLFIKGNPNSTIHRVKEVVKAPGPNTYPLREAKIAKRERATEDVVEDGTLEELEVEEDVEMPTMEEIEDMERQLAIEDEVTVEGGALQRIPRTARIYMPRVGPPPRRPELDGPLDDSMAIKFKIENTKRPSSLSHEAHELYKIAKTVGEARRLGASTGHIKYDLSKGHAKLEGTTAVVCFGPSYTLTDFEKQDPEAALAAPLLEAWCDEKSPLGEIGKDFNRDLFRFTEKDDLSLPETVKKAHQVIRQHPGCHLHGSLPCTQRSSWPARTTPVESVYGELASRAWSGPLPSGAWPRQPSAEEVPSHSNGLATARAGSSRSSLTCYAILIFILYPSMVALRGSPTRTAPRCTSPG